MNETLILVAVFLAVLITAFAILHIVVRRREIERNIGSARERRAALDDKIDQILATSNPDLRYYLDVVHNAPPNSLRMRLVQAGFFKKSALVYFNIVRVAVSALAFTLAQFLVSSFLSHLSTMSQMTISMVFAGFVFIFMSVILESLGRKRMREYRKVFPDFMDLLLVCVDAGLSINAAVERVTREFLVTIPDFGMQLSIINLEIRAGRPMDEALHSFANRINVDEARTLAVLFKQSQELGSSIAKTLRVFSREMRQKRIINAEEKANALPIKMLFPMALFMFPVNLIIVLVPIMMTILAMLLTLSPS